MARVEFTDAHNYTWRYNRFEDFSVKTLTKKKLVLQYDENLAGGDFEPERSPYTVEIKIKKGKFYTPEQGEFAGEKLFSKGKITDITWKGQDGETQVHLTGTKVDAGLLHLYLLREPFRLYDALVDDGSTFIGNEGENTGVDITTGWGDDTVEIKPGNGSYIKDYGGADTYTGAEDSFDTITYDEWFFRRPDGDGIVANLAKGWIDGPDGLRDTVVSIDRVVGTQENDKFVGSDGNDNFNPLRGNDKVDGGAGFDQVRYDRDADQGGGDGIKADLSKGKVIDGFGTVDKLKKVDGLSTVEGVHGTDVDDEFRDDAGDNYFRGRAGNDTFYLSRGRDFVDGNEDADRFIFLGDDFGNDVINDFNADDGDRIEIRAAGRFADLSTETTDEGTLVALNENATVFLSGVFDVSPGDFVF